MENTRSTVRDLRRRSRSALLSKLYFDGPLSRQELSQLTGLSVATVSNVIGELVEERLIIEAGLVDSDGGRPRVLLRVDPRYGNVIGIDVGETGVMVELFDLTMARKATVEHPLRSRRPDPAVVVAQVASALREVIDQAGVTDDSVIGVGIGLPGTVEREPKVLIHAQVIGWDAVPFEELLRDAGVSLPLFFDNGAKTQGQAELWFGAGRGARHAVIALVGSGVGAAVITDGSTYQGATSSAGEWGHTTIVYGGRQCRCGARGCLEAYVGAEAVLDRYQQAGADEGPDTGPGGTGPGGTGPGGTGPDGGATDNRRAGDEQASLGRLIAAADHSPVAAKVLADTAGYLGAGIADLINLFNPERIVLGGWAGIALGAAVLPQIRAAASEHALRRPFERVTIEMCALGPDAVAFGAATLPVAALLAQGRDPGGERRPSRTDPLLEELPAAVPAPR